MLSLCHFPLRSSTLPGIRVRRLGESDTEEQDDVPMPQFAELAELCHLLGDWTPSFPSAGGPRASPDLVEAVLASVEAEAASGEGVASSPSALEIFDSDVKPSMSATGLKRLRFYEDTDEGDSAGTGSKRARTDSSIAIEERRSSSQSVHPGDEANATLQAPSILHQWQSSFPPQPSTSSTTSQHVADITGAHHAETFDLIRTSIGAHGFRDA
ncbi:hypothetical protein Emed_003683 [Eimeria media]